MAQVLDYSAGFPGAVAIKRAGYDGAVRYIGFPDRGKCTTRAEYEDFSRNGLGMALVFEESAGNWRGGRTQGAVDGRRGRDHANAIGWPADRPIYMAIDQDVVQTGEFATMLEYLRGANQTLGGVQATGVYGEADVIDRARDAGVASRFWQTAAWSRGRRTTAHLFQRVGTVYVGGIACDINDILSVDWGQHNAGGATVSAQDVNDALTQTHWDALGGRNVIDGLGELLARMLRFTDADVPVLKSGLNALSDDEVKILAALSGVKGELLSAVAGIKPGEYTDEQVSNLCARLKDGLGEELAQVIGHKLIAQ